MKKTKTKSIRIGEMEHQMFMKGEVVIGLKGEEVIGMEIETEVEA